MGLLDILFLQPDTGRKTRRRSRRNPFALFKASEILFGQLLRLFSVKMARYGQDYVLSCIKPAKKSRHIFPGKMGDHVFSSGNEVTQRMILPGFHLQMFMDQVFRRIFIQVDLVGYHAQFLFQVFCVKPGPEDHIAQDIQRIFEIDVQSFRVIAGTILACKRVHIAAQGRHLIGQRFRAPAFRSFKQHMLDHVGHAVVFFCLVHGSGPDPYAHGNRPVKGKFLHDQFDLVFKCFFVDHPIAPFFNLQKLYTILPGRQSPHLKKELSFQRESCIINEL